MKLRNTYYLLRHGESLKNIKGFESCWPEKTKVPLTKKGERDAKKVAGEAKRKKIDLIFSSDILRTKQTAGILGKTLDIKPKFDKRLREINIGIFNGQSIKDYGKFWNGGKNLLPIEHYARRFRIPAPKGEDYRDVEKRLSSFIKETEKRYKGKNIVIVGHSRPLTLLEKIVYKYPLKKFVDVIINKKEIKTGELRKLRK